MNTTYNLQHTKNNHVEYSTLYIQKIDVLNDVLPMCDLLLINLVDIDETESLLTGLGDLGKRWSHVESLNNFQPIW